MILIQKGIHNGSISKYKILNQILKLNLICLTLLNQKVYLTKE